MACFKCSAAYFIKLMESHKMGTHFCVWHLNFLLQNGKRLQDLYANYERWRFGFMYVSSQLGEGEKKRLRCDILLHLKMIEDRKSVV